MQDSNWDESTAVDDSAPVHDKVQEAFDRFTDLPPAETEHDKMGVIEALLFVSPEPLKTAVIAEVTGFEPAAIREMVSRLQEKYVENNSGIILKEVAGGFSFFSRPEAAPYISCLIRQQVNPRLSRAALETVAIVAYLQPVSRGVVAEIRGIQSEGVMKTLEERGIVHEVGKGGPPGYPALYGTTRLFLQRFGLASLEELPDLEGFAPDDLTVEKIRKSLVNEMLEEEEVAGAADGIYPGEDTEDPLSGGSGLPQDSGEADL